MIVVDASVVVDFLIDAGSTTRIRQAFRDYGDDLHAPGHLDLEVASALRRHVAVGALDPRRADAAMADLADLAVERHDLAALMPRVWSLREQITAYDAAYLALAEALDAPLLTRDARLARAHGHDAVVQLLD